MAEHGLRDFWRTRCEQLVASGIKVHEWCAINHVHAASMYAWLKRFHREDPSMFGGIGLPEGMDGYGHGWYEAVRKAYVEGMVEGLSLRKLAARCGVCLKTSWYMRMRVCSVMDARLAPFRCDPGTSVQIDEKYPNESLSGNRDRARVKMPREPHANGHGVTRRGLSKLKACVLTGVNDLGMVNALHSRLESFLVPFNGVSTRRLPLYLSWFCWEEQARRSDATRLGMLAPQVANGTTGLRIRAMWDEPQPFFDEYWGGRVWACEVDPDDLYEPEFVSTVV